jgi:hypothetical protein
LPAAPYTQLVSAERPTFRHARSRRAPVARAAGAAPQ